MKRYLALLLFPLLLILPSCGALAALQQRDGVSDLRKEFNDRSDKILDQVGSVRDEIGQGLEELEQTWTAAHEQADVNKDGKVEGGYEQLLLLLAGGGGLLEFGRRKLKALDSKHEESKNHRLELEARIEHEREKRKDGQVAALEAQLALLREQMAKAKG